MGAGDKIVLRLPCKAEYVSVARLTVSGIANRAGFDIETIEDIKVAVSEVCSRIINVSGNLDDNNDDKFYEIYFEISDDKLTINFSSNIEIINCLFEDDEDGLGISIIKAFMDEVEFCPDNKSFMLKMAKSLEGVR